MGDPPPFDKPTPVLGEGQGFMRTAKTQTQARKVNKMTLHYGYSKDVHQQAELYIKNEIIVNQTYLINAALLLSESISGIEWDNVNNYPTINDEPGDLIEIYEWWLVSDWLAEKLQQIDEVILSSDVHSYWGRSCTGQAIILDGTIQRIVEKQNLTE